MKPQSQSPNNEKTGPKNENPTYKAKIKNLL